MITLYLLHPIKHTPVQVWPFKNNESVIRIGRSTDNHVILYSAVVSRHHVELRRTGLIWEVVSLGTNGTYLEGKRIDQAVVTDGTIIRLARSGPNIRIRLGVEPHDLSSLEGDRVPGQRTDSPQLATEITEQRQQERFIENEFETSGDGFIHPIVPRGTISVPQPLQIPKPL